MLTITRIFRIAVFTGIFLLWFSGNVGAEQNCFSVVVGKDVSADGWVIMAHNEDDSPPQIVNHFKEPRRRYPPGSTVTLINGGKLEQVEETWSYFQAEMPGYLFSDSFLNEWGVCITSDACPSREDQPELTDGGITKKLRQLVAQRAVTARQGVKLAGKLVERFGYGSSGRTYIISDPNEGWLCAVVHGKHWAAERVPDDQVAMIANTYTLHTLDLTDTLDYLASADIVDYAAARGWYDPERDGAFDFAAVYAHPRVAADSGNICRQWAGLNRLSKEPVPLSTTLPFSVDPKHPISVADVMDVLRDHYEGTPFGADGDNLVAAHQGRIATICNSNTATSFIAQLRGGMPTDIGLVYWVALAPPCTSVYIPFHFGIAGFPTGYAGVEPPPSQEVFRKKTAAPFAVDPESAFWTFTNFSHHRDRMTAAGITRLRDVEALSLSAQDSIETIARKQYDADRENTITILTDFSERTYRDALNALTKTLSP